MNAQVGISVSLQLSEKEARWLMGYVQNRMNLDNLDYIEPDEDSEMREKLFGVIRNAFDEAGE